MDIKECYEAMHGDYEDVFFRLRNNALIIKLVKKFESDQSYAELKQGLADKDAEKAFRAAHTLKGICLNLGFSQLIEDVVNITEILRAGNLKVQMNYSQRFKQLMRIQLLKLKNWTKRNRKIPFLH